MRNKVKWVWMRVSKWWQFFKFWINYPFISDQKQQKKKKMYWNHRTSSCKRVKMMTVMLMKEDNISMHVHWKFPKHKFRQHNSESKVLSSNSFIAVNISNGAFKFCSLFGNRVTYSYSQSLPRCFQAKLYFNLSLSHTVIHCSSGALKQRLGTIVPKY